MSTSQKEIYFYPPALQQRNRMWHYNSIQWGEEHADRYMDSFYDALEEKIEAPYHRPFPKPETAEITDEKVYYFHWKRKQSERRGYTVFYRIISNGNMGVIAVIGDGQDRNNRMRESLEKALPHIEADQQKPPSKP